MSRPLRGGFWWPFNSTCIICLTSCVPCHSRNTRYSRAVASWTCSSDRK